ncbi:DUF2637 domain-containing protein [Streptomyces sp. NBC_01549]|uniref:DUF2637 domain-containing protein n=1 Tax=Streptomyces sp. NBC_01549 TaxID=2975874 RepID=UPI002258E23D|nr:DUF2637 domain-containing protein [Streptomyces sp. NBC_01549]MCX4598278.1 DUF2637 domain-containing protein [Streptomyces sp. NBC_01549]
MVVTGAVIIAGIGFAGSYAAVRELAFKKGFGNFSYVFPIGVDAGICVLLALDLLLTWIRIPFPLLRQTAWLLTIATIAFNGAAAWPDPLGVGMHAVIPILFVVSVEAARHAIGRIADITADKHMEGVRLTRWMLSPIPTFLLWRRMKLWELRSYDQVIKLEQERLVYQASLHSRFGRAWRRKAPVEALMPLRLARYGVPLAETAPAGLAAAGIEHPPIVFTVEREPASVQPDAPTRDATAEPDPTAAELDSAEPQPVQDPVSTAVREQPHDPQESTEETAERFAEAYRSFIAEFQIEPTPAQWALWLRDTYGISTGSGGPLSEDQAQPLLQVLQERYALHREEPADSDAAEPADQSWYDYFHSAWRTYAQEHGTYPDAAALAAYVYERDSITGDGGQPITGYDLAAFVAAFQEREFGHGDLSADESAPDPGEQAGDEALPPETEPEEETVGAGAQAAKGKRTPRVNAAIDDPPPGPEEPAGERAVLTTVDRYYLAWMEYQTEHGEEPTAEQLSAYLAQKGMHGRGGKPVSPANLRRYFLPSRVYNVWAEHRMRNEQPAADAVAQDCAARGITAQYNKPVTTDYITENAADFERRRQALIRHHADAQQ